MDRDILKQYDALKSEQVDIRKRIRQLEREMTILLNSQVADTVKGTRPDGTFGPIKIKGIPFPEYERKKEQLVQRMRRYEDICSQLDAMIIEIEAFITSVQEPRIRLFLRWKYVDGLSWRDIGRRFGKGPSWAFRKCEKYFAKSACSGKKGNAKWKVESKT